MTKSRHERIVEAYEMALKVGPNSEIGELMPAIEAAVPDASDTEVATALRMAAIRQAKGLLD